MARATEMRMHSLLLLEPASAWSKPILSCSHPSAFAFTDGAGCAHVLACNRLNQLEMFDVSANTWRVTGPLGALGCPRSRLWSLQSES